MDIFEINVDNRLRFDNHIATMCKKINGQFDGTLRFRKLISKDNLLQSCKAFVMLHLNYCSSVWHFCGARSTEKIDALNKRILRFTLQDHNSPHDSLFSKVNSILSV